jgi:hypothetical protein
VSAVTRVESSIAAVASCLEDRGVINLIPDRSCP